MKDKIETVLFEKLKKDKEELEKFTVEDINNIIDIGNKRKKIKFIRKLALVSCIVIFTIIFGGLLTTVFFNKGTDINFVANNNIIKDKEDENNNEKTFYLYYETDELKDISDIEVLKEDAHQIVIAKVINIDGCTNYNQKSGNYTRINTLGDIKILQVLKGDLEINSVVPFIRGGGTISYNDYQKGVIYGNRSKIQGIYDYVTERRIGDIEISMDKTYLMFLYYDSYNERYEIMAYQYGLREYDVNTKMVLNNDTNVYQSLDSLFNIE